MFPLPAHLAPGALISPIIVSLISAALIDRIRRGIRVDARHALRPGVPRQLRLRMTMPSSQVIHGGPCGNGYRSAKRQGKPNFTTTRKRLCRRHSCNFASAREVRAFTPRSSRYLNCPSNLIGHDHPNKPANGGANNREVLTVDRGRARARAANNKRGDTDVSGTL